MPRSGGTYTLPSDYEATSNEVISSATWNGLFEDIEAELTASATKTPQFVTVATSTDLPNERALAAESGVLTLTDGGAGSTLTVGVATNGIALAKMAQVATARFLGRVTAATGNVEALTGTQATTLLDAFTDVLKGLAPASGGGTTNFLRADGSWATPPGTGGGIQFVGLANNMEITASVGSSALTVALKTAAGADASAGDPITLVFPSATESDGSQVSRTITAASSIVISSGSTLGTANSTAFRFWLVAFDDAGTVRLGLINCRDSSNNIFALGGYGVASSTAEGGAGAADSAHVFYTGTAVTTKPFIVLGYVEYGSGLGTAGTYSGAPTRIRMHQRGMKLPGDVVQVQQGTYATNADLTTTIPVDDTIPQNTEGTQLISFAMTNNSPANKVEVDYSGMSGVGGSAVSVIFAAFTSASANAIHACSTFVPAGGLTQVHGGCDHFPNSGSAITYSLRVGPGSATTIRMNGTTSGRLYGGIANVYLRAKEIMS